VNTSLLDKVVDAVLYEGHILYPYRPSSKKNRQRFTFGRVYPQDYSIAQEGAEPFVMQTECLTRSLTKPCTLEVSVRFLHPMAREIGLPFTPQFEVVPELRVDGHFFQTWQEAVEREIKPPPMPLHASTPSRLNFPFGFPASQELGPIHDQQDCVAGMIRRRQNALEGAVEIEATPVNGQVFRITVRILNQTPMQGTEWNHQDAVLMRTFASTHAILHALGAEFLSMTDPPADYQLAVAGCKNLGTWPVLVGDGEKGERDTMLSSPIILSDYPQIAPESPGNLFDGTEMDEMLTLRILTMTGEEKQEMRQADEFGRRLLERTEGLDKDHLLKMHGVLRGMRSFDEEVFGTNTRLEGVAVGEIYLRAGDRVRIRPRVRADVMDLALQGKTGVIESVEQDAEERIHLALVLQEDPGMDLGLMRQPGHRFFYGLDEIEPLREGE